MKNWSCRNCGKPYETYAVILDDNVLSMLLELEFRKKYYNQKQKIGICEKCSKELRK